MIFSLEKIYAGTPIAFVMKPNTSYAMNLKAMIEQKEVCHNRQENGYSENKTIVYCYVQFSSLRD